MTSIKKILCAVEPNPEAKAILSAAKTLAERYQAELAVLHVIQPIWQPYADLNFSPLIDAQVRLETDFTAEVRDTLTTLCQSAGIGEAPIEVRHGYPITAITDYASDWQANLVVLGAHNRRGISRLGSGLLGSTAHGVLNRCPLPLLAVHPDDRSETDYRRVLISVDTHGCGDVLAAAKPFIAAAEACSVLHVLVPLSAAFSAMDSGAFATQWPLTDMASEIEKEAQARVTAATQEAGLKADQAIVAHGDAIEEICNMAVNSEADMLIMGSGQRSRLDRLLLGSTCHGVLNRAPCDVLIGARHMT